MIPRLKSIGAPLSQHGDLSTRFVLLHAPMRLKDLIQKECPADLDVQCACRDPLD
jgi:hypothetical protein